jgi:hypothetical protein
MSFQLSRRDVDAAYSYANRSMRRLRDPEKGEGSVLKKLATTGEVLAGAAIVGVASGRFGPLNIPGTPVPVDLAGGVGAHLLAFWLDTPDAMHLHNVANGILAGYVTKLGVGVGAKLRTKAGYSPFTLQDVTGAEEPMEPMMLAQPQFDIVGRNVRTSGNSAAPLTEAELAALAQQVR